MTTSLPPANNVERLCRSMNRPAVATLHVACSVAHHGDVGAGQHDRSPSRDRSSSTSTMASPGAVGRRLDQPAARLVIRRANDDDPRVPRRLRRSRDDEECPDRPVVATEVARPARQRASMGSPSSGRGALGDHVPVGIEHVEQTFAAKTKSFRERGSSRVTASTSAMPSPITRNRVQSGAGSPAMRPSRRNPDSAVPPARSTGPEPYPACCLPDRSGASERFEDHQDTVVADISVARRNHSSTRFDRGTDNGFVPPAEVHVLRGSRSPTADHDPRGVASTSHE